MASLKFAAAPQTRRRFERDELLAAGRDAYFSISLPSGSIEASEDFAEKLEFILGAETSPKSIFERIHQRDRSAVDALIASVESQQRANGEVEFRVETAGGEERWLRLRLAGLSNASHGEARLNGSFCNLSAGSIGGAIMLAEEITDRQRRAAEIAGDQERLRAALAIADAAVWEYDLKTGSFYGSERLAELAGRDSIDAKWAGEFITTLHPEDAAVFEKEVRKFWSGAADRFAIDVRVSRPEGGYRWLRSYISTVGDRQSGRVIGFLKDIGSLKEAELAARSAEERAKAASDAKSQFLATMSHEIRTPLNGVLGMASALEASTLNRDQRAMLSILRSSGEDLLALLNDLLDMSKVESGKIELNETIFSLPELVERVAALFAESAQARRTQLKVEVAPSAQVYLRGDGMRLRQILNNLVSNAIKFTEDGEVTVSVGRKTSLNGALQTVIEVTDTGIGISADQLERIFEPFVQLDSALNRRYGGTGLGLTICRRLVDRMRGTIEASSLPGQGSVFRVVLPLAECSAAVPERSAVKLLSPRFDEAGTLRVLVAEDNRKNQIVIEKVLSATGAQIIFAGDGQEAVSRWRESDVDLVLMDVRMPVADGLWASREIRKHERLNGRTRTPIIALSADATGEGVIEALEAGMDAHISKPIQVRPLLETIAAVIHSSSSPTSNKPGRG